MTALRISLAGHERRERGDALVVVAGRALLFCVRLEVTELVLGGRRAIDDAPMSGPSRDC